jgi:hypothetical protein
MSNPTLPSITTALGRIGTPDSRLRYAKQVLKNYRKYKVPPGRFSTGAELISDIRKAASAVKNLESSDKGVPGTPPVSALTWRVRKRTGLQIDVVMIRLFLEALADEAKKVSWSSKRINQALESRKSIATYLACEYWNCFQRKPGFSKSGNTPFDKVCAAVDSSLTDSVRKAAISFVAGLNSMAPKIK